MDAVAGGRKLAGALVLLLLAPALRSAIGIPDVVKGVEHRNRALTAIESVLVGR